MAQSIGILNNIRQNGSAEYQARIPEATQNNISAIGNALQTYTILRNEFANALINKIGKTILEQKLFKNRLARFKSGTIQTQQDVEEIFLEMAKSEGAYDPTGANPLGRRTPPDVKAIYHRMNRRDKYVISIGDLDFARVFRSPATLDAWMKGLINSVYSGAEYDEWLAMKNLINTYTGYASVLIDTEPLNADGVKKFVKTTKKLANDLTFPSTAYNSAGVKTWSNPGEMVLLINKDVHAEVETELYANTFNKEDVKIPFETVIMDGFETIIDAQGQAVEPYAILVDKDWFRVYDTLSHMEPQRNADGMFTNYFYHVHQILSASTFKNAVVIGSEG